MARYWQPKHKCYCIVCGWKGIRTGLGIMTIPCPACWSYLKGFTNRKKINHISAIGKNWQTVRKIESE